jgi:hypothetical protein
MHHKNSIVGAVLLTAVALASQAGATEVKATSYSAWLATVSGTPAEWNFVIPGGTVLNTAAGYNMTVGSFGPINISGPDGSGYTMTESSSGSVALIGANDGIGVLKFVTPAGGLTAFGLGVGLLNQSAAVTLSLSDGETFTLNPAVNGSVFIGLSSATPITSFVLSTTSGAQVEMNDFLAAVSNQPAGTQSPAAEVATALMIGSGLLFFVARRKLLRIL